MTVILTGRLWNDPWNKPITADFYLEGSQRSLFTYEAIQSNSSWTFALRDWGTDDPISIAPYAYPILRNISLDLTAHEMNGTCTNPASNTTATMPCMWGSFTDNIPPLHLTSAVPLGTQSGTASPPNSSTTLDAKRSEIVWAYREPYMILRLVDPETHKLGHVVLRTARQDPRNCGRLKVCVGGINQGSATELVGAEVMAPLALLLVNHALYAATCSYHDATAVIQ